MTIKEIMKRYDAGGPVLRNKSEDEAMLVARGYLQPVGYCWFEPTAKGWEALEKEPPEGDE